MQNIYTGPFVVLATKASQGKDGRTPGDSSVEITLGRETPALLAISLKKQRATRTARRERQ